MLQQTLRVTDVDARRLELLVAGLGLPLDSGNIAMLRRLLDEAETVASEEIGPDVVTLNSEVQIRDLDTGERRVFRVALPGSPGAGSGRISVLAPMGMAVLGRSEGDHVTWRAPAGVRRLRVERVLHQPEREGRDLAIA